MVVLALQLSPVGDPLPALPWLVFIVQLPVSPTGAGSRLRRLAKGFAQDGDTEDYSLEAGEQATHLPGSVVPGPGAGAAHGGFELGVGVVVGV